MRIAIVGAGVAGLTAAYRLDDDHDVTLFEATDRPGGHANTVDVEWDGRRLALDTGFMVFNRRTYPHFVRLLEELRIDSRPTTMSFSVTDPVGGLEYNGHSINTLFAQRRNLLRPGFWRMLRDVVRFNREARGWESRDDDETLGDVLARGRYSREFRELYLLPMGAAIWSCPNRSFAEFPVQFVAEFFRNHGLLDVFDRPTWYVVEGGSRTYVQALLGRLRGGLRSNSPIRSVRRFPDRVELHSPGGAVEAFDHVVLACHADQALRLLGPDATGAERDVLGAFPYQRNTAVLHTDESLLPRNRRARACWNVRLTGDPAAPSVTTYDLGALQGISASAAFCLTLNADDRIDPRRVLRTFEYHHPVFTTGRRSAQRRHSELIDLRRTSYCGAYWRNGFHEDGVVSALAVAASLRRSSVGPGASSRRHESVAEANP